MSRGPLSTPAPAPAPNSGPPAPDDRHFLLRYAGLPANGFTLGTTVIAFLTALVAGIVGGGIVGALIDPDLESDASKMASQAMVVLGFVGAGMLVALIDAGDAGFRGALDRFGLRRFGLWMIGIAGLAWLGYFIVQLGLVPLLSPEQKDVTEELGADRHSVISIVVVSLLVVPGAALGEEILFRGVVFAGLRKSMSLWPAAALSSVVWALLHLVSGNPAVAVVLTILGLFLCWAYERSGSLWTPICAHAFNNTIAVLTLFLS